MEKPGQQWEVAFPSARGLGDLVVLAHGADALGEGGIPP